ncbi:phospholipase C/P1 nuclease family protein [Allosphingosinicella deserti]|uniref:nuclease n=1 Tax=Allosphingosinicella deserti TaxID=2116704 RepID=UPI00130488B0|nr:nuclease [Sphingomonas deserti]
MRHLFLAALAALPVVAGQSTAAQAWGERAHAVIDRAAIEAIPDDGPIFLRKQIDFIAGSASLPDSWRGNSENFSKIEEDPNHGWFKEQFAFLRPIPRSRYEFVLALHKQYDRIKGTDPETAGRTNIRWTGTLPYAAIEAYDRLVVCMRAVRAAQNEGRDSTFPEQHCAFQVIRLGHYIGDGSQPLHDSIHSDGWRGDNPQNYTRDRSIHGRFESGFVDAIALSTGDIAGRIGAPGHRSGDMFDAILAFLDEAAGKLDSVYTLEKRSGFADPADKEVRALVYERTAAGASMLRDMLCRAWEESAAVPAAVDPSPLDPANPRYNPETGSAPD